MNEIIKLTIIDFDSMENDSSCAISAEDYYFKGNDKYTAHKVCGDFVQSLERKFYLGWNEEVYPQFKVEKIYIRE